MPAARADRKHELLHFAERSESATTFSGSAAANAKRKRLRVPLLGQIPIDIATREAGDRGMPIAAEDPKSAVGAEFNADRARAVKSAWIGERALSPRSNCFEIR